MSKFALGALSLGLVGVTSVFAAPAKEKPCIDYYSVGASNCQPIDSTPLNVAPLTSGAPQSSVQPQSEVDRYLADYGKPPREFVEFYLNPTSENASKWVTTYQQMIQKGQDLSKAWSQADQLYAARNAAVPSGLPASPTPEVISAAAVQADQSMQMPSVLPSQSFGAFAGSSGNGAVAASGVREKGYSLTYYFSQTCPYCARMTPDLAILSKEMGNKLALTCVDVTPVGPQSRPDEAYITSKLPCKWRLPDEGEVERQQVRQTPTLWVQKEGSASVRLSGYVPISQLRRYF